MTFMNQLCIYQPIAKDTGPTCKLQLYGQCKSTKEMAL